MAASLGEQVGETVGYRIRLESRVGPKTRIAVITEGVLTRLLQADPALEGVGLVIFDEFHERSLHADLGLALCLQSRAILREDLRILVMSATLEAEPVAALLGGAPVLASEGRSYPMETRYLSRPVEGRVEPAALRAVLEALASDPGDLLVFLPGAGEIRRVAERLAEAAQCKRALRLAPGGSDDVDTCGLLLAFAYPDRIAQRRANGRFLLRNGRGAAFPSPQPLDSVPYLVAAELDNQGVESRIFLAAPVSLADLEQHFSEQIAAESLIAWDRTVQAVRARRRQRLGALLLRDEPLPDPDPEGVVAALLRGIAEEGLAILPWTRAARQLQERLLFMHRLEPGWPDVSDEALTAALADWLGPHLYGLRSRDDLQRLHLAERLEGMLSREQRRELEAGAPTHIAVPSGSRIAIEYSDPGAPVLAVRLQELFGQAETPRIARGRVPLTLHLLSPAHRPVQVTRDLASFWQSAYFAVRKDLRGRYPKHHWPEDPLSALPTNRTRPRT